MAKTCKRCGEAKPGLAFYDRQNVCKVCRCEQVRAYRAANLERVREYDRARSWEPHRIAARNGYARTERGKERMAAGSKEWAMRNPERRKAHILIGNALRGGKVIRMPCQVCGDAKTHAHHDDYTKPLEVRWLCAPCHTAHHKEMREQSRMEVAA